QVSRVVSVPYWERSWPTREGAESECPLSGGSGSIGARFIRTRQSYGRSLIVIVRPRPGWGRLLFVLQGSILPRILPHIFGFALYAAAMVATLRVFPLPLQEFGPAPFALLGVALSLYL